MTEDTASGKYTDSLSLNKYTYLKNISKRTDIVAYGNSNGIQITDNGKKKIVDSRTAVHLI